MIGAYASVAVVCVASVVVGQAVLLAAGRRRFTWLSAAIGLAGLLITAGIAIRLPGHGTAVAIAIAALVAASVLVLVARPPEGLAAGVAAGLPAALLALAVASIPFIAAGRVGILGVGLVNDDMASHLLMASWLDERFTPEPVLIDQGYPLGPHALVAGLAKTVGGNPIDAFAGLTLAIPALTAMVAFGALAGIRPLARTLAAAAVALPYLVAAYLAQEALKEPIMALFLLAFALLLPLVGSGRSAIPLGVLAAGVVYVYSFPGVAWLGGTALAWAAIELVRRPELRRSPGALLRGAAAPAAVAIALGLVLVAPDLGRVVEFGHFRALDPDRANVGGLGNLGGHLSPLEALGVWPTSEFRLAAGAGGLPALAFYAGAALGLAALTLGLPRWVRRHGWTIPAALVAAILVYAGARAFGTVYTSAKALAILSPLVLLTALGGLLEQGDARGAPGAEPGDIRSRTARTVRSRDAERPPGPHPAATAPSRLLALALIAGTALSSFLVLRQAPVGPEDHMNELAQIRPLVQGEKLLFLGRDNFVLYELRGSKPFTHVRNFYDPYFVKPNFELKDAGSKFDFDAVTAETLARFPYVVTTRAPYASGPPPGYEPVQVTASYVLWRSGDLRQREPVERGDEPGTTLGCSHAVSRLLGAARPFIRAPVAVVDQEPVLSEAAWSPSPTLEGDSASSITLELPHGRWQLSLQYDSTRPVSLSAPGLMQALPGNLDYRGVAPFWPAGEIRVPESGPVRFTAAVERVPLAGRLLGAHSVGHLGRLAATPAGRGYVDGVEPPYPGESERLVPYVDACGKYSDWSTSGRFRAGG